jgi:hypothetical protein
MYYIDYFFIPSRLYIFSGYVFAHHQEHLTAFTVVVVFTQVAAGWCPE